MFCSLAISHLVPSSSCDNNDFICLILLLPVSSTSSILLSNFFISLLFSLVTVVIKDVKSFLFESKSVFNVLILLLILLILSDLLSIFK
jgi:hypothetical protein